MSTRNREARERRMAVSHSQPSTLRYKRTPFILPQIKSKRPHFYQQVILSPDYVRIDKTQKTQISQLPQASTTSHSRVNSILISQRNKSLYEQYAEQDRVVQRYQEEQQSYKQLLDRIHQKSIERHKKAHKKGISLIYSKLMGIL